MCARAISSEFALLAARRTLVGSLRQGREDARHGRSKYSTVLCSRGFGRVARPRMRVLEEEAEHLLRSIGPSRIGVGPSEAAARPTMASSVNDPLFEDRSPACVSV